MGSTTEISWCDKTWNPWRGCTPARNGDNVAPECQNCYARTNIGVKFRDVGWGDNAPRVIKAESGWGEPYRWNRAAVKAGTRPRVFCGSLCDFFEDRPELAAPRERTWRAIQDCKDLTWMLLTKRPENLQRMVPWCNGSVSGRPWSHVWLGTTVGHPDSLHRVEELLKCPAAFKYLSCEPLLGKLDLAVTTCKSTNNHGDRCTKRRGHKGHHYCLTPTDKYGWGKDTPGLVKINWLIIGAESGPHRRPCKLEWVESLVDQADTAGIPAFVKQLDINGKLSKDPAKWPKKLRRRELPGVKCD